MNVFPDVDFMARRQPLLDDDNQWDVEPRVASLKPEAVDVSPPLGSIGRAIRVSTMNIIALELRRPGRLIAQHCDARGATAAQHEYRTKDDGQGLLVGP